jgi:hypothetical protein
MGNEQSANLSDGRTREETQKFIERTDKTTAELKEIAAKIDTMAKEFEPDQDLRSYVAAQLYADCMCNLPKQDFRNPERREECVNAQLHAFDAKTKLFQSHSQHEAFEQFSRQLHNEIVFRNNIIAINKPIFGSSQYTNL